MAKLIMNDEIDYTSPFYPTHIVSKDMKLIRVFIGVAQTLIRGLIGLYIKDSDYNLIRHDKSYIFIHDPDATNKSVENIEWGKIENVKDKSIVNGRNHIHIWKSITND